MALMHSQPLECPPRLPRSHRQLSHFLQTWFGFTRVIGHFMKMYKMCIKDLTNYIFKDTHLQLAFQLWYRINLNNKSIKTQ